MPQTMKYKRDDLLKIISQNRESHRSVFLEALEGYREMATKELEGMLEEAKKNKRIRRAIQLTEPMDMTKEYDRIIKMLTLTTEEEVELDQTEFAKYVMDDWAWKEQFTITNSRYLNK